MKLTLATNVRYLVFAGSEYYPNGGFRDLIGAFTSYGEAHGEAHHAADEACKEPYTWARVTDLEALDIPEEIIDPMTVDYIFGEVYVTTYK